MTWETDFDVGGVTTVTLLVHVKDSKLLCKSRVVE